MKIGEVARAAGVAPSTIRYYEAVGILPPPLRKNGVRCYERETIDDLRVLRFYRSSGIPIRGLASIAKRQPGDRYDVWIEVLKNRIDDLDSWIGEAQRTRRTLEEAIECRCNGNRDECTVLQAAKAATRR